MKIQLKIYWLCFFLFYSPPTFSQDIAQARKWIDTLASEAMFGRGYVKNGDKIAAQFIAQEYARLGLKKMNYRDNFFQYFQFNINTFPNKISLKLGKRYLRAGYDFLVNPISKSGRGRAKVVQLDSTILHSDSLRALFEKQNLKRKAVVYASRDFKKIIQYPQVINQLNTAKAIIELHDKKLIASLSTKQLSNPIFEVPQNQWNSQIKKIKFRVDAKLITNYTSQNVIGYIEGKTEPDSFLVITAHYDHLGMLGKKAIFRGAHDNASGVALLLSLANHYAQPENQPKYSVVFMAFGGEEIGLLGSKYYTENPFFDLKKIKFLINLDMISTGEDGLMVVNGAVFKNEFEQLQAINQEKKYFPVIQKRGIAANSDHYFFTENGVKAFYLYTLGTSLKAYHDVYDLPQNLPLNKYTELYKLIIDFFQQF
ncbi:MAG: M28 family peptidase [Microscillaceae bacterium]|nr:M28 family peptidase [Microscillaceae bacterium]MDW8461572.1 M28 family peptidase [Cytophagales bacterium]